MSRNQKILRVIFSAVIVLAASMLVIVNVHFDPDAGIVLRGDLELSWETPTKNSDNTPLADLAGYTIYCWNAESQETKTIVIEDPRLTSYRIEHVPPGTYHCAVSAVADPGIASALSDVVTKKVW